MTFIEAFEKSKRYINDSRVTSLINDNSNIVNVSTISDPKDSIFGLVIVTNKKSVATMLMKDGIKLSDGTIIKVKVTYDAYTDTEYGAECNEEMRGGMGAERSAEFNEEMRGGRGMPFHGMPGMFNPMGGMRRESDPNQDWLSEQMAGLKL